VELADILALMKAMIGQETNHSCIGTAPDGIGGAGRHPGPHEGHELAKKLIILVVVGTVPYNIGGAGRHPGPHEGHDWPRN
jgi:hypothetical protein